MSRWGSLIIGQVVKRGVARPDTVRVRCLKLQLDENIHKYFNIRKHYWAIEQDIKTNIGDIILLEHLPQKLTPLVSHQIKEHIFKIGAAVDPITGKRCRGTIFIDEELRQLEEEQIDAERSKKVAETNISAS